MSKNTKAIRDALNYLSGVCDFARTQDGHGFNKPDTHLGHGLALLDVWTPDVEEAALEMLQKYRGQLVSAGIELPEPTGDAVVSDFTRWKILEATKDARADVRQEQNAKAATVTANDGMLFVSFPGKPDSDTLDAIKAIPGRRWRPDLDGKPWSVDLANFAKLREILPDATWDPDALEARSANGNKPAMIEQPAPKASAVSVTLESGKLAVRFAYGCEGFQDKLEAVKSLPDRSWEKVKKYWAVPTRLLPDVMKLFPDADYTQEVKALLETQEKLIEKSNQAHSDFRVDGLNGKLMPFQAAGVEFVTLAGGRAMIADSMGLGKTIQAIAYLQNEPIKRPVIIVVPASLKINWQREIDAWLTTKDRVAILSGTKPHDLELESASIFIINYDILAYWVDAINAIEPQMLICDESHFVKNKTARRSKAVYELAKKIKSVILLTGTPVTNRPSDLYELLKMLAPKDWGNFWQYANRYCDAKNNGFGWDFSGASNLDELHEKIKTLVIRRTKDQVLKELPAKVRVPVALEISKADQKAYAAAQQDAAYKVATHQPGAHLAIIETLKQAAAMAKMKPAIDWIENFLDSDEKLVVFATHTAVIDQIMDYFGEQAVRVTGNVTMRDRQTAVDRFQNDDSVRLFVGNIQAAGVGLTLTAASNVCFLEYPWTPADLDQAESRTHRIGQTDSVTSYCLMAVDTIDEDVVSLLERKSKVMDTILDGQEQGQSNINILSDLVRLMRAKAG